MKKIQWATVHLAATKPGLAPSCMYAMGKSVCVRQQSMRWQQLRLMQCDHTTTSSIAAQIERCIWRSRSSR
eukprot:scaffold238404_cov30-Tisochrysis_lutea.AAC.1